jgi:hypothetical protein
MSRGEGSTSTVGSAAGQPDDRLGDLPPILGKMDLRKPSSAADVSAASLNEIGLF